MTITGANQSNVLTLTNKDTGVLGIAKYNASDGNTITYKYTAVDTNHSLGVITLTGINQLGSTDIVGNSVTVVADNSTLLLSPPIIIDIDLPVISNIVYKALGPHESRVKSEGKISLRFTVNEELGTTPLVKFQINSTTISDLPTPILIDPSTNCWETIYTVPSTEPLLNDIPIKYQITKIVDLVGNETISGDWIPGITLDTKGPTILTSAGEALAFYTSRGDNTKTVKPSEDIILTFTTDEEIQTPTVTFHIGTTTLTGVSVINTLNADQRTWQAKYTVSSNSPNGAVNYTINYKDLAGNNGNTSNNTVGDQITIDTLPPTIIVDYLKNISVSSDNWVKNGEFVELQFTNTDISTTVLPMVTFTTDPSKSPIVTIATVQCVSETNNKYTATFTVNAGGTDGKIFYKIHNIYDGADNKGADVNGSNTLTIDTTKPIIENVSLVGSVVTNRVSRSDKIMLSFTSNEPIENPQIHFKLGSNGWVMVPGADISNNVGKNIWSAEYTVGSETTVNNQLVQYKIAEYTDLAGNTGDQVIGASSLIADTVAPTIIEKVCISSGANANWMKIGEEVQLTFTTDEKIQTPTVTFKAGDDPFPHVTVTNSNGDQKTWKAVALAIQGDWSSSTGTHQINYIINDITDLAGNISSPSPSLVDANISFNPSPPSHLDVKWYKNDLFTEITTVTSLKKNDKILIELIYSDNVTVDLTKSLILKKIDGTTTLGTANYHSGGVGAEKKLVYTYTVSESYVGKIILNGVDHLDVKDLALNPAKASNYTTPSPSMTIDVGAPTVTHIVSYSGPGPNPDRVKNGDKIILQFKTDELIMVSGSQVKFRIGSNLYSAESSESDVPKEYWFEWTVPVGEGYDETNETPIEYQITKIVDTVGNKTTSSIWTPGIILDNKAPNIIGGNAGIIFTTTNSNNSYAKKGDTIDMTFTADEEISVPEVNFKIGEDNTGVDGTPLGNNKWRISYTLPTTSQANYTGLINYTFTKFEDLVGNSALPASGTSNITYIRDIPTVTVTANSFKGSINDSWVKVGEQIQLSFTTSNELKSNPSVTFVTTTPTDPVIQGVVTHVVGTDKYDVIGVIDADSPNGQISYKITDIYDKASNPGNDKVGGTESNLKVDTVAPSITNTSNLTGYRIPEELIQFTFTADEELGKTPTVTFKVGPSFDHSSSVQILQTTPFTDNIPTQAPWVYTVSETVASTFANGILSYKISDIEDKAGNKGNDKIVLTALKIDTDSPIIDPTSIVLKGDRLNNRVKASDKIMLSFTVDEKINAPTIKFKIGGTDWVDATKTTHVGQTQWSAEYIVPAAATAAAADNQLVQYKISGYTDLAGNLGAELSGSSSLIADTKAPEITPPANFKSSGANPDYAKVGDEITLEFTTNEETQTPIVTFNKTGSSSNFSNVLVTNPTADQKTWKATYSVITGTVNGMVGYSISVDDLAGNSATPDASGTGVTIDTLLPEVTFESLMDFYNGSNTWVKDGSTIRLVFTSNDISGVTTLPKVTFFVGDTLATATKLAEVQSSILNTGSPGQYIADLIINNTTYNGLIFYKIHEIFDIAGNKGNDLSNSDTLKLDTTVPSILESSITFAREGAGDPNWAKVGDTIRLTFSSSEIITEPTVDFKYKNVVTSATVTPHAMDATCWMATLVINNQFNADTSGKEKISYEISNIKDQAGNVAPNNHTGSKELRLDMTSPTITDITWRKGANGADITTETYFTTADEIYIEFTYDEIINITNGITSIVKLEDDTATMSATFVKKDGDTKLIYKYTVLSTTTAATSAKVSVAPNGVTDLAGNEAVTTPLESLSENNYITIDTTAPTITISSPTAGDCIADIELKFILHGIPVSAGFVTFERTGGTVDVTALHTRVLTTTEIGDIGTSNGDKTLSLTNLPDLKDGGIYTITLNVTDLAGNSSSDSVYNVTYDSTPPEINAGTISFLGQSWVNAYGGNILLTFDTTKATTLTDMGVTFGLGTGFANTSIFSNIVGAPIAGDYTKWTYTADITEADITAAALSTVNDIHYSISISGCEELIGSTITASSGVKLNPVPPTINNEDVSFKSYGTGASSADWAKTGEEIKLTFKTSEKIQSPTVTFDVDGSPLTGVSVENPNSDKQNWVAKYVIPSDSSANGKVGYKINYMDLAGNTAVKEVIAASSDLTIDTQAPVISNITLKNDTDQNIYWVKKGEKIKLTFTSDSNLKSNPIVTFKSGHSQFDNSTAVLMGQVATTKHVNGDNTYNTVDYIVSDLDITDGLISYEISNIEDEAGNQTANIKGSATLKLDTIIPVVNDISLVNNTNGSVKWIKNNESISLTFSENANKPITVSSVSFRIGDSNSSWENAVALTGSITSPANLNDYSSSWTITYLINHTDVSTEKTIFYNITGIEDKAGNLCADKNGSTTLQLDTKPPIIDSITWHAEENGIAASATNILYFNEGKTIYIRTAYSEPIILPATHSAINLSGFDDSASHNATYLKQVGNTLIYKYTIRMGDTTINYLSITPPSSPTPPWYNNITDRAGNKCDSVPTDLSSYVNVDTTPPAITPRYNSLDLVNNTYINTNVIGWVLAETNTPLLNGTVVFNPTSDNTGSPPSQTCALTATELTNTGSITSLTNKPSLTSGVKYDIIFTFEDKAGNITIKTVNNITYDNVPPALKMETISFKNTSTDSVEWVKDGECIQLYFETTEHILYDSQVVPTVEFKFGAGSEWGEGAGTLVSVPPTGSDNNTKWTSTYDISANDVSGAILYKISNISDRAGNMMNAYEATGNLLKLDRTVPEIVSIDQFVSSNSLSTKAKKGDTITLKFTTSEPVVNPPIVTFGGKTTNVSSNDTSLLSWTATRTVDDTDTDGAAVIVKVILTDRAGNPETYTLNTISSLALPAVTIDRTPPQILTTPGLPTFTSDNSSGQSTRAKLNDTITLTFIADQEIQSPVVTFGGKATIVSSTGTTNQYTATRLVDASDAEGIPEIAITMKDIVGNETIITSQSTYGDVTIDTISPILTIQTYNISGDNSLARRATKDDTIILEFTTNEQIQKPLVKLGTITIPTNDVTQNPTDSTSNTSWKATLTILGSHPDGIITPTITYCDLVGNMGQSYSAPTDITIDKVLPQLIGLPIFKNKTTNSFEWIKKNEVIQFTFTTDKTIQQPTVIFDMSGTERAATTTNTTGNIWISEYTTTDLDPEGVVTYKAVTCEDLAGNQYTIPARPTGATPQLVFDKTAPTISGITLGGKGSNSYINNIDIGYTLGETNTISSGSIIFNEINGGSITRTLTGGELSTKSSAPLYEPITLNSGSMYNIVFTFTDIAGNSTSETVSNVTYDTTPPQINENSVIFHNSSASPHDINWIKATEKVTLTFDTNKEIVAPIIVFKSGGANFTESVNLKTFTTSDPNGSDNNTRWTVEYSIVSGDQEGTIFYKIDYTDLAGNAGNSYSPSSIFKLDRTPPIATFNKFYSNNTTSTTVAAEGDAIILEFTTDEQIKKPAVTFGSLNATVTQNTLGALNASWIASYTIVHNTANMTIGVADIGIIYNDLAGNPGANSHTVAITNTVEIDTVKPRITSVGFGAAYAKEGDTITLTFEADEEISKPLVTFGNKATLVTDISTGGTNGIKWAAAYNVNLTDALTNDKLGYTITFYDKIGNKGVDITPSAAAQDVTLYSIPIITSSSLVSDNIYSTQYAAYDNKLNLTVVFNNKLQVGTKPIATLNIGPYNIMEEMMTSFGTSGTTWTHQYHVSNIMPPALMNSNAELPITYTISNVKDLSDSAATVTDVIGGVTFDTKPPTMEITFGASVKTSSSTNTTSDRNIKLVFTSSEDTSNFTIDDITVTISGGTGIAGVLSNFNGSGKIYTADFAPSYDKTYTVSVPSGVFTDGVGNPISIMATFIFTYDGIAENIKLAKKVANWHYYNLHDEYLPGVPTEAPVETATAAFRKSLLPAAKIEYDKIMMKAFHKTMNTP